MPILATKSRLPVVVHQAAPENPTHLGSYASFLGKRKRQDEALALFETTLELDGGKSASNLRLYGQ